jgi:hypothetical protein
MAPPTKTLQTFLDSTRTLFGRHRTGALFPMQLCVKTTATSFVGIIQKLFSSDQYVNCSKHGLKHPCGCACNLVLHHTRTQ